ncbi:GFA family protein [Pseudomonas sp. Marseille-QA0892]
MNGHTEVRGACVCGAVHLTLEISDRSVAACHCGTCRRWGGGPLLVAESDVPIQFESEEDVGVFATSDWAERGFCKRCGSHLFYRLKAGGHYSVPVGLLDSDANWKMTQQVFVEERPAYYSFAQQTEELTGEQLFAQFKQDH